MSQPQGSVHSCSAANILSQGEVGPKDGMIRRIGGASGLEINIDSLTLFRQ